MFKFQLVNGTNIMLIAEPIFNGNKGKLYPLSIGQSVMLTQRLRATSLDKLRITGGPFDRQFDAAQVPDQDIVQIVRDQTGNNITLI